MSLFSHSTTLAAAACFAAFAAGSAGAQETDPTPVSSGVSYQLIERWDVDKLNEILTVDTPKFFGVEVEYTPAQHAVNLYRVTYPSVIPEMGDKPTIASGLIAIPDTEGTSFPMVSYQHGTVYEKQQVPSFPDQSPETQLMIAQFAGQGYVLIGADYFGMGISPELEGYMVKGSHQQATLDMIRAAQAVLDHKEITTPDLYISGWSQGGFVTMALLEKLETVGLDVKAAATASAPMDAFVAFNGFLNFPRPIDADWITTIFILSAFSFENYYGVPGLARSLIKPEVYDIAHKAYLKEPVNIADIPTDVRALISDDYVDTNFYASSAFGRLTQDAQTYRWVIKTPTRNYYGETDEAIRIELGRLAMTYQQSIGNDTVEAVSTGPTSHRGTYATAVPEWKKWFDSLNAQ
ncbi:MAG: S9 family peptidase [Microvirga sp.]|nr:S9 family peptidase [Microvirga sp.]